MSRTYFLAYLTVPGTDPMEQIKLNKQCGYDFVSLWHHPHASAQLRATDVPGSVWTRERAYYTDEVGKISEMAWQYYLNYNAVSFFKGGV